MEIRFSRTKDGSEVDFILVKDRKPIPIEVKSAIGQTEIPNGLKSFLMKYPHTSKAYVVNQTVQKKVNFKNCDIHFLKLEEFEQNFEF